MIMEMIVDEANLNTYPVFDGIHGENLKTIVDCVRNGYQKMEKDEYFIYDSEKSSCCIMILEGRLKAEVFNGGEIHLEKGMIFGKGFFEIDGVYQLENIKAMEDCVLMYLDYNNAFVPCWFCCFFHAALIDNLEEIHEKQMKLLSKTPA